jgi:hypothetical protein
MARLGRWTSDIRWLTYGCCSTSHALPTRTALGAPDPRGPGLCIAALPLASFVAVLATGILVTGDLFNGAL